MVKKKKKKNKANGQSIMSDKQFIKEVVRQVPIAECYMDTDYEESGLSYVIVARKHKSEKYTIGCYMIDTFCVGLKDTYYYVRIDEEEYKKIIERVVETGATKVAYEEAHNLIYGAIAFAEEVGIMPIKDFELTKYILEEDTEEIPLIEYNYGKDGKYYLVASNRLEASKYLPFLEENLESEEYSFVIDGEENEEDDGLSLFRDNLMLKTYGPDTRYTYIHPEYPAKLNLENPIVNNLAQKKSLTLTHEEIGEYLALPHDSLRRDLEHFILYLTGKTCNDISEKQWEIEQFGLVHALILLGEVGNEESLDVVLETLRQSSEYMEYHFGDISNDIYPATINNIASHSLDKLLSFAKEEGLYTYLHYQIFPAITIMMQQQPERRNEFIAWWREVLQFAIKKIAETQWMDSTLCGLFISDLADVKAHELLPEIKSLFETGLVDEGCCGKYQSIERDILSTSYIKNYQYQTNIYERYKELAKWE